MSLMGQNRKSCPDLIRVRSNLESGLRPTQLSCRLRAITGNARIEPIASSSCPVADIGSLQRRGHTRLPCPATLCLNAAMPVLTRPRDPDRVDCRNIAFSEEVNDHGTAPFTRDHSLWRRRAAQLTGTSIVSSPM
jgi:hypothetical protein